MLRKVGFGELKYRDQEKNVIIAVFENQNSKKTKYGTIALTILKGQYKESVEMSIPEFERVKALIDRMPKIKKKSKKA